MGPPASSSRLISSLPEAAVRSLTRPQWTCAACRARSGLASRQRSSFTTTSSANAQLPFSEKIRRKIWGSDTPPGPEDPYKSSQILERAKADEQHVQERKEPQKTSQTTKERAKSKSISRQSHPTYYNAQPDPEYVPATSWEGLEELGSDVDRYWNEHFDRRHAFKGFLPATTIQMPQELSIALHRAVVEVFTLQQAGLPLTTQLPSEDLAAEVQIRPIEDGLALEITYPNEQIRLKILGQDVDETEGEETQIETSAATEDAAQTDIEATEATEDVQTNAQSRLDTQIASWDPSWLSIPINHSGVRFAVTTRILQLTGHRVPDPVIGKLTNVSSLLEHLVRPEPPKKLAESLLADTTLAELPNLRIFPQRVTPIDKETMLGRWKVIEKQLTERDLPVTGGEPTARR